MGPRRPRRAALPRERPLADRRALLHAAAVAALGLLVGSALIARQAAFVATLGLAYGVAWLVFYYDAVWRAPGAGP